MVPAEFANFFLACAGAGGALIGLLFVAISINPERTFGKEAPRERQAVAASAYTALVNAFFVSIGALIPGSSLGALATLFGMIGLLNTGRVGVDLFMYLRRRYTGRTLAVRIARGLSLVAAALVLYGSESLNGYDLIQHNMTVGDVYAICGILLGIYGIGLVRAWELLGAPRSGIGSWFNPLADLEDPTPSAIPEAETERIAAAPAAAANSTTPTVAEGVHPAQAGQSALLAHRDQPANGDASGRPPAHPQMLHPLPSLHPDPYQPPLTRAPWHAQPRPPITLHNTSSITHSRPG